MRPIPPRMNRRRRRGNAVVGGSVLSVALGLSALVVDLGFIESKRLKLQHVADAAATAGASRLDGTEEGLEAARKVAIDLARMNRWNGSPVVIEPNPSNAPEGEVVTGIWDDESRTFTPSIDHIDVNAVRVSLDGEVDTAFARFLGVDRVGAASEAAVKAPTSGGASEVDCYLPIALPDCVFDAGDAHVSTMTLRLNPAGTDNAGWARFGDNPSASWVRDQLVDDCQDGAIAVDDTVMLNNGVMTSALQELATQIEGSITLWDSEAHGSLPAQAPRSAVSRHRYGRTLEGVIPLFGDDSYCTGGGGSWNHGAPVTGFAWVSIYDVQTSGPARDKNIWLRVDTVREHEVGSRGNGPDYGVVATGSGRMVR